MSQRSFIDGPKLAEVPDSVKNNRPRIWCAHCNARNGTVADASRHYRDSHPQYAATEKEFWCFEIYSNSRHGWTEAAQLARDRTEQVAAFLHVGTPITAAPIVPVGTGINVYAALASELPRLSTALQARLAGDIITQDAPAVNATVTQTAPLPPAASIPQLVQPATIAPTPATDPYAPASPTVDLTDPTPAPPPSPASVQYEYPDPTDYFTSAYYTGAEPQSRESEVPEWLKRLRDAMRGWGPA